MAGTARRRAHIAAGLLLLGRRRGRRRIGTGGGLVVMMRRLQRCHGRRTGAARAGSAENIGDKTTLHYRRVFNYVVIDMVSSFMT